MTELSPIFLWLNQVVPPCSKVFLVWRNCGINLKELWNVPPDTLGWQQGESQLRPCEHNPPQSLTRYLGPTKLVKEAAGGAESLADGKQREKCKNVTLQRHDVVRVVISCVRLAQRVVVLWLNPTSWPHYCCSLTVFTDNCAGWDSEGWRPLKELKLSQG